MKLIHDKQANFPVFLPIFLRETTNLSSHCHTQGAILTKSAKSGLSRSSLEGERQESLLNEITAETGYKKRFSLRKTLAQTL